MNVVIIASKIVLPVFILSNIIILKTLPLIIFNCKSKFPIPSIYVLI